MKNKRKMGINWKNKEEVNEYHKRYRKRNKGKIRKSNKKYFQKNQNKIRTIKKEYNKNHPEICLKATKKWRKNNSEKVIKSNKDYRKKNPEKIKAHNKVRVIKIPKNQLCQKCNKRLAKERHHEDYSKPLQVEFLCKSCHKKIHIQS